MCRRTIYLFLLLAFGMAPAVHGAKIIWVSDNVKYDFDALVVGGGRVLTFGGDRETFDFADPENYLRVDNDVWSFGAG